MKKKILVAITLLFLFAGNTYAMHKQVSDVSAAHVHNANGSITYIRGH